MENTVHIFTVIFITLLILLPFVFRAVTKNFLTNKFGFYLSLMVLSILLIFIFAYSNHYSTILLLKYRGYDYPCLGVDGDCYANVENLERVKQLKNI